ncbi:MAG: hypothetical protein NT038_11175 [Euryarchaeota archaeon]|nr:hypothetical protein [Euryarchaeota archaeon]
MSRRQEIKSDRDGNFLGDADGKFLLEDRKSTRHVSGAAVGKCKSDGDGNCFSPGNH